MCLITFAFQQHPRYPIVFAGNRDESYQRASRQARFWDDHPTLLAGKDLEGGGTWLGVTKSGKFATVTNFRDSSIPERDGPSRGQLVLDYLTGSQSAETFVRALHPTAEAYNGFNLLVGDAGELFYLNNFDNNIQKLEPGVYGLSNHRLNNDWPKVKKARDQLSDIVKQSEDDIKADSLFDILYDEQPAPDRELPDTGLSRKLERKVSPIFIETDQYGTRSSTVVLFNRNNQIYFDERYHEKGQKERDRTAKELRVMS